MKNKVQSGFLTYLLIFVGVILAVVLTLGAIMILSPGVELFGYSFYVNTFEQEFNRISVNNEVKTFSELDIENITINVGERRIGDDIFSCGDFSVRYECVNTSPVMRFQISDFTNGFTKHYEEAKSKYEFTYEASEKKLTLTVTSPLSSFRLGKKFDIIILIPQTYNTQDYKINLHTTSGNIDIGIGEFSSFVKEINCSTEGGGIFVGDKIIMSTGGKINLLTKGGAIRLGDYSNILDEVNINSEKGDITLGNMNTDLNITSQESVVKVGNILGNVSYNSEYGLIQIGNIAGDFSVSEETSVSNLRMGIVEGDVMIPKATTSHVFAKEIQGNALIRTTSGQIDVQKALGTTDILTEKGTVNVLLNTANVVNIVTSKGKINATIERIESNINLTSTSGEIDVKLKSNQNLKINYTSEKSIKFAGVTKQGTGTEVIGNGGNALQVLSLTTNNAINITEI